jgi:hypothetical protein
VNDWKEVTPLEAVSVVGALLLVAWLRLSSADGWVRILDDANLVFHEAGHPIFGLLGPTAQLYGGTWGQLVFPLVTSLHFWRQKETSAFALCLAWFFENFLNISRYMADARAQILPLVGGGEHDWTEIFTRWGVLPYDTRIAGFFSFLGWLGICGCGIWIVYRLYRTQGNSREGS